jgi:hypothetical protein
MYVIIIRARVIFLDGMTPPPATTVATQQSDRLGGHPCSSLGPDLQAVLHSHRLQGPVCMMYDLQYIVSPIGLGCSGLISRPATLRSVSTQTSMPNQFPFCGRWLFALLNLLYRLVRFIVVALLGYAVCLAIILGGCFWLLNTDRAKALLG